MNLVSSDDLSSVKKHNKALKLKVTAVEASNKRLRSILEKKVEAYEEKIEELKHKL
jgi:hypothetical protein